MKTVILQISKHLLALSFLFVSAFFLNGNILGQQVIGTFPNTDGGFEGQANGTITTTSVATGVQRTDWTISAGSGTASISATGGRSGPKILTAGSTSATARRYQSPTAATTAMASTTAYTVQYYYKTSAGTAFANGQVGNSPDGTTQPGTYAASAMAGTSGVWTKVQVSQTSGSSAASPRYGLSIFRVSNVSNVDADIDDFVVYAGAADNSAPASPGAVTVANPTASTLDVSWVASASVDGGGYVVVRYASSPGGTDDPNQNGIYAVGNTVTGGVSGTVVYIGTGLAYADAGLAAGTTYYYKVYTVDKAFNYSAESSGNGTTTGGCTPPATQATVFNPSGITGTQVTIGWTAGNGTNVLVVAKQGSAVNTDPTSGVAYTADTAFGAGTQLGTGNFVVYDGLSASPSVTVTGLTIGTTYYFAIYEYGASNCYNTAELTGNITTVALPSFTAQPSATSGCPTSTVNFTCTATNGTITYQWQESTNGGGLFTSIADGGIYSGATSGTLTLTGITSGMNTYQYRCIASNVAGSTNSTAVALTVTATPSISSSPSNSTVCINTNTTFSVSATGAGLTYQWQSSSDNASWGSVANATPVGTTYTNATTNTLAAISTSAISTYYYRCVVSGTCAPAANSASATLTVNDGPTFVTHPSNQTVCSGIAVAFTSAAAASPAVSSRQWEISTNGGGLWTALSNGGVYSTVTTATLNISSSAGLTGNQYRIIITSGSCSLASNAAILTVTATTSVSVQPVNQNVASGSNATFTVTGTGAGLSYQWEESINGGGSFSTISNGGVYSGATTATLTLTAVTLGMTTYQYRCVITGTCGNATSDGAATLTVTTFVYVAGDFRSTMDYADLSWNNSAGATTYWEYFDGTSWGPTTGDKAPQNAVITPSRIIISNIGVTGGGSNLKTYNDIVIVSGGELILVANDVPPVTAEFLNAGKTLEVQNGGILKVQGDIDLPATGNLIVRTGGIMYLDQNTLSNIHPLWDGIENFENNSTIEINNWDYTESATNRSLMNVSSRLTANTDGWRFGNLIYNVNTGAVDWTIIGSGIGIINLVENNFTISNAGTGFIIGVTNKTGTNGIIVNGNLIINSGSFSFGNSFSADVFSHQITVNQNFEFNSSGNLKVHRANTIPTTLSGYVNFKGNVTIASTATFDNDKATDNSRMYVNYNGSGTSSSPQFLNIGCTATGINMNVKNNTFVKLKSNNLTLNGIATLTTTFAVETGSVLHFGWADDGTTPLLMTLVGGAAGTNKFDSQQASTLYMTHSGGLNDGTTLTTSNLQQFAVTNRTINQTATFWYVGKVDQVVGNALTTGSTGKVIIVDMLDNTKVLTLSNQLAISNGTTISATGGKLDIRTGIVQETTSNYFTSCTGTLYMSGGTYRIPYLSQTTTDLIPRMDGVTYNYSLTGGTVELQGAGDQIIRGARDYFNIKLSGAHTLGTTKVYASSAFTIANNLEIIGTAILDAIDASNNALAITGNAGLTMSSTSRYRIKYLTTAEPQLLGLSTTYSLTGGTVEFYGASSIQQQNLRGNYNGGASTINYYNVEVNADATNVDRSTTSSAGNVDAQASFVVGNSMTVFSPASFRLDETENISGAGSFTISAGATLLYGSVNGIKTSGTGTSDGNIRISGTRTFPTTASYGFVSVGNMVTGNGLPASCVNLHLLKTNATDIITQTNAALQVTNNLNLRYGIYNIASNNIDLGTNTTNVTITPIPVTSSSYIQADGAGLVKQYVNTAGAAATTDVNLYRFPIGDVDDFSPCAIHVKSATTLSSGAFLTANVTDDTIPGAWTSNYNCYLSRYWTIEPSAVGLLDGFDYESYVYYNPLADASGGDIVGTESAILPCKQNVSTLVFEDGVSADMVSSAAAGLGVTRQEYRWAGRTSFSRHSGRGNSSLPIEILSFTAKYNGTTVDLNWATASEINNDYFTIERSADAVNFEQINITDGAGNSNQTLYYSTIDDAPLAGVSYYRLKQTDFNGTFAYSDIVSVNIDKKEGFQIVNTFTSSATESLDVTINCGSSCTVDFELYDMTGKKVFASIQNIIGNNKTVSIPTSTLSHGIYLLKAYNGKEVIAKKVKW